MIPGTTTKLSEGTLASADSISPKTDIVLLTGTAGINTIIPTFGGGFSGMVILIPLDGAITIGTGGNILTGITSVQNRAIWLVYVRSLGKWSINSGV